MPDIKSLILARNMSLMDPAYDPFVTQYLENHAPQAEGILNVAYLDESVEEPTKFESLSNYVISKVMSTNIISPDTGKTYRHIILEHSTQNRNTHDEEYAKLLAEVLEAGHQRTERTNTGTLSLFARQMRFDISKSIPLLTTKYVAWKSCIEELLWFLKGDTDATNLMKKGVPIWNGNTSREFLDQRGLFHMPVGDIGAGYGFQWRHFGAEYHTCKDDYNGEGIDQIQEVIKALKQDPFSRRIFMSAWNPAALTKMALPPCHVSAQFYVQERNGQKYLSCHMYQRSVDCFLGLPFNIMSYTTLTYILAKVCDMQPDELIISTGDTHIYLDHIERVQQQIARSPACPPKMVVSDAIKEKNIEDWTLQDFDIVGYFHHPSLKAKMAV